jgi:hypothetical protein
MLKLNQRVQTPSGRRGTILVCPGGDLMPLHALVQLDARQCDRDHQGSDRQWIAANILQPIPDDIVVSGFTTDVNNQSSTVVT